MTKSISQKMTISNLEWWQNAHVEAVKNVLYAPFFFNFRNFGTKRDTRDKTVKFKFIDLLKI